MTRGGAAPVPGGGVRGALPGLLVLALASSSACSEAPTPRAPRWPDVLHQAVRPTEPEALFHYEPDSEVRSHARPEGQVRVHYATQGRHRTLMADRDGSGVPDFVESVARIGDEVWAFWAERGFASPVSEAELPGPSDGGDARFDIYLVDFDISSDGYFGTDRCDDSPFRCAGHLVIENDFEEQGYPNLDQAVRILVSHEFFHAIQAAYDGQAPVWWNEACAVWAEEEFYPQQNDFEGFLSGFFDRPERSLDVPLPGPVDPFSYGLAIFPRFLGERFGPELLREAWEALVDDGPAGPDPGPLEALEQVLARRASSVSEAYGEFALWNLFTGARADPARAYENGRRYPQLALAERGALPYDGSLRVFHLAAQYLSLEVGERSEVTAALAGPAHDGLRLALLAELPGRSAGALLRIDAPSGPAPPTLDTRDAARVLVALVQTAVDARSVRPFVCVGDPAEVETCRAAHAGPPDPEDLGPGDLGPGDLGPGDLGPGDLGPPDLSPEDLGPDDQGGPGGPDLPSEPDLAPDLGPADSGTEPDSGLARDAEPTPRDPSGGCTLGAPPASAPGSRARLGSIGRYLTRRVR